jgi:glycosyltransferase involved in cell wall biosynthesis
MRVAFVTYDFKETGGQGRFSQGLVSALRKHGVEIDVVEPTTIHADWLSRAVTRFGRGVGFSCLLNLQLRSLLNSRGVDLIHANGGPGGVFLSLRQASPIMYTAHHTYSQQARLVDGQSWKSALAVAEKAGYRKVAAVTADTRSTADALIREYRIEPSKVSVIPCGVDFEVFRPTTESKSPHTCLFVGRLDARKGFSHLIRAWPRVVESRPDSKLVVIGTGPERTTSEKFLADAGLTHTVSFLGRVDTSELVRRYREAQCVAVPSVFEGFGLAALEALACGTRVVARDVEGLRDVVTQPEFGSLVPAADVEAFADAIIDEFHKPRAIIPETRASLIERYNWPVVAQQYTELYESVLLNSQTADHATALAVRLRDGTYKRTTRAADNP